MKCLCLFLLSVIVFANFAKCGDGDRVKSSMEVLSDFVNKKDKPKFNFEIPKGVIWEGWVKYVSFTGDGISQPKTFFENDAFLKQRVTKVDLVKKDKIGYVNIPSKFYFYAVLLKDELIILNSRTDKLSKNHDSLYIDSILPLGEDVFKSTIQNLGDFEEGSCVQIFCNIPQGFDRKFNAVKDTGVKYNWVVCLNNKKDRDIMWKLLVDLKFKKQKNAETSLQEEKANAPIQMTAVEQAGAGMYDKPEGWLPKDGYWVLLQDWSQCTVKCGGGKSVQQWMCVPPKKGGRPCEGTAIRSKPCNTQPCPGQTVLIQGMAPKSELNEVKKPIIQSLPFSSRPQVYQKCVKKEEDVFYLWQPDETLLKFEKRPARVIMNSRTISLFNDGTYANSVFTFDLKKTQFAFDVKDSCCFILSNANRQFVLCGGFGTPCAQFTNDWNYHFATFQNKCYNEQIESSYKAEDKALEQASERARMDIAEERADLIKNKLHEQQVLNWDQQLLTTETLAAKALRKEVDIEKLLQQEIQLKGELEAKNLLALKKQEQKKQESLAKILQSRETENTKIREAQVAQKQLQNIKLDAQKEVEKKREDLKKKIMEIQKKAERRKKMIEQDINVIRNQMTKNLMDANKNGDQSNCSNAYGSQPKIDAYCNTYLVDDFNKNNECKNILNFCYICCENEFGTMYVEKRDQCYNTCDDLSAKEVKGGDFVWNAPQ